MLLLCDVAVAIIDHKKTLWLLTFENILLEVYATSTLLFLKIKLTTCTNFSNSFLE